MYGAEVSQKSKSTATRNKNLKNLDEHEFFQKLIDQMFQYKVCRTDALIMCRELNTIQGFSEESIVFKNENKKKSGELKKTKRGHHQILRVTRKILKFKG